MRLYPAREHPPSLGWPTRTCRTNLPSRWFDGGIVMNQPFCFSAISTGVVVLSFTLFSPAIQTAQAQLPTPLPVVCLTPTIDMKLLVVSNGKTEADFPAIKQILDYLGTPYDVLDMAVNPGGITSSMLSDGSCHGYYQGVIFAYGGYHHAPPRGGLPAGADQTDRAGARERHSGSTQHLLDRRSHYAADQPT